MRSKGGFLYSLGRWVGWPAGGRSRSWGPPGRRCLHRKQAPYQLDIETAHEGLKRAGISVGKGRQWSMVPWQTSFLFQFSLNMHWKNSISVQFHVQLTEFNFNPKIRPPEEEPSQPGIPGEGVLKKNMRGMEGKGAA